MKRPIVKKRKPRLSWTKEAVTINIARDLTEFTSINNADKSAYAFSPVVYADFVTPQ
jgi:hypothetical protein